MATRKIAVLDFETDPFQHGHIPKPFLAVLQVDGEEPLILWGDDCADRLADHLERRSLICFAHNGGKFDFHFLLHRLAIADLVDMDDQDKSGLMLINGRIARAKIGKSELRDSYCILPTSLKNIQKDSIDYAWFTKKNREAHREEITRYCIHDCQYLLQRILAFRAEYGTRLTLASSAFKYWKDNFYGKSKIRSSPSFDHQFRLFYFGGRTQAIAPGVHLGKWDYYDINSAYPFAMRFRHPWGRITKTLDRAPTDKEAGRAFVTLKAESTGAFPVIIEGGELRFPADGLIREFKITGWEYLAAKHTGTLRQVSDVESIIFRDSIDFAGYVDHFYRLKSESPKDSDAYLFAKLFMNSLYGKFAQNPTNFEQNLLARYSETAVLIRQGWSVRSFIPGGIALLSKPADEEARHSFLNVATAASITGFVRAMLWTAIHNAGKGALYCDTDSLIADKAPGKVGKALGEWKVEMPNINRAWIGGPKLYCFEDDAGHQKKACKGAQLSAKDIKRTCAGETVDYYQDAPTFSIKSGARFIQRRIQRTAFAPTVPSGAKTATRFLHSKSNG